MQYAQKLNDSGYHVELNDEKGTFHGYDQMLGKLTARQAFERRAQALRKAFL